MNDEKIRILDPIWGEPVFGSRDHEPGSGTQGTGSGNRDPDFILDPQDWYVMKFYNKIKTRILLNFIMCGSRIRVPGSGSENRGIDPGTAKLVC